MQISFPTVVSLCNTYIFFLINYLRMFTSLFENLFLKKYQFWLLHFSADSLFRDQYILLFLTKCSDW